MVQYLNISKKKNRESFRNSLSACFRASCRIRTNDPEITNHVLWPTELKRQAGKLSVSRRYNQTTFATFPSWRIRRELAVQDLPMFFGLQKYNIFFN